MGGRFDRDPSSIVANDDVSLKFLQRLQQALVLCLQAIEEELLDSNSEPFEFPAECPSVRGPPRESSAHRNLHGPEATRRILLNSAMRLT